MILRDMRGLWISLGILLVTSWILKRTWYDRLPAEDEIPAVSHV
jgi:hypothetical protein